MFDNEAAYCFGCPYPTLPSAQEIPNCREIHNSFMWDQCCTQTYFATNWMVCVQIKFFGDK